MDFFSIISLLGGLALFLYGMNILGSGLEKVSGGRLEKILESLTSNIFKSVMFGALVTAAVQSSSATTVIVVGLVNSRILKLRQAIGVIMGANIGTTFTAHILRLTDLESSNFILMLIKPTTLAPLAAIIGILLFLGAKKSKHKDLGQILLGFGVLFTGMFNMESAVYSLRSHPAFAEMFSTFANPVIGVIVGALVTAIIQSSSASVGILQALSSTGQITYAAAFPIIMGQNIGTCVTPLLASIGASKNAKRSAVIHLSFNIIGTVLFLIATYSLHSAINFSFWDLPIDKGGIANFHTTFNLIVTFSFIPFANQLEKLATFLIKDNESDIDSYDVAAELDERFMVAPGLAIQHGRQAVVKMGELSKENYMNACHMLKNYDKRTFDIAVEVEDVIDTLEDKLNVYLLNLSKKQLTEQDSRAVSELLHIMSEYERIGDYSINMLEAAELMNSKGVDFSSQGMNEIHAMCEAVLEIIDITTESFKNADTNFALNIEPLEEVIDLMEETLKDRHINRLKQGLCSVDAAFPFVETLSNLERIADHCSNVGLYILTHEKADKNTNMHIYLKDIHKGNTEHYTQNYARYEAKYYSQIAE